MDDAHFGVTNEQRKARKAEIKAVISGNEDNIFDIPAIESN
jgi:hypothetical protein